MKRYGTLCEHYGALQKFCGVLWRVVEHYGALPDITERYRSVVDRYGSVTELLRNVMEHYRKYRFCPSL